MTAPPGRAPPSREAPVLTPAGATLSSAATGSEATASSTLLNAAGVGADELPALNAVLRRTRSLEKAAAGAKDPAAALAYLKAADKVIQVDDFAA